MLRSLPRSLQMKVASFQYEDILTRNEFLFAGCNTQFLHQLIVTLREARGRGRLGARCALCQPRPGAHGPMRPWLAPAHSLSGPGGRHKMRP